MISPKITFIGLLLHLLFGLLWGYDFPVKKLKITSLFGESRGDHFHTGMDFATPQPIYPIYPGKFIFYFDRTAHPEAYSFGVGNLVVIEHFDKLRSYYLHLADNSINKSRADVSQKEQIGVMGDTGKSYGSHLHLTLVDSNKEEFVNPNIIFPRIKEKIKPVISTFFTILNGKVYKFSMGSTLRYFGPIQLYAVAGDLKYDTLGRSFNNENGLGLKMLKLEVDDKLHREFQFSSITVNDKKELVSTTGFTFAETYGLKFNYKLGEFTPTKGKHKFRIIAEDWNGNVEIKNYSITFK